MRTTITIRKLRLYKPPRYVLALYAIFAVIACSSAEEDHAPEPEQVRLSAARTRTMPDELAGFGSLSFIKKIDVATAQEARLLKLQRREGEEVAEGAPLAVLENPQITLAVERARESYNLAAASLDLARAALLEAEFYAEAQLRSLEKTAAELAANWAAYHESERKYQAQQVLYLAGGVNEEAMRVAKFALENELRRLNLAEEELSIRRIGFRERDLHAAGLHVPSAQEELTRSFIVLASSRARAELAGAQAREGAARKELESALVMLNDLTVKSPAAGIIAARYFEEGERLRGGDKLFTLIDAESLYASIAVREADAFRLEKGMMARVSIDGTSTEYEGAVDLIAPVADSQSFSFTVRILLPKETLTNSALRENSLLAASGKELARPGMFARAVIRLGPDRQTLCVKEGALINNKNGEGFCLIYDDGSVSRRKLILGSLTDGEYEVISGLQEGERVILYPPAGLREGDSVVAIEQG